MLELKPEKLVPCNSRRKLDRYLDGLTKKYGDALLPKLTARVSLDGDSAWSETYMAPDGTVLLRTVTKFNRSKGVVFVPENVVAKG